MNVNVFMSNSLSFIHEFEIKAVIKTQAGFVHN